MEERNNIAVKVQPFLKWAGGKRWFVSKYLSLFPSTYNRYIEPFLGSGAIFFALRPRRAILADINKDLIDTYTAIKLDWKHVLRILRVHHRNHDQVYYYRIRESKPRSIFSRAARFIYLNRTCWNGLYRVNLEGEFNVPIGTKTDVLMDTDDFLGVSRLLKNAQLMHSDFETVINEAEDGDLLFVDPPYTVKHSDNGFIKYNEELFHWDAQVRLSQCLMRAKDRGAMIILTNAHHESIEELYNDSFQLIPVKRSSIIAADPSKRKMCGELIIKG